MVRLSPAALGADRRQHSELGDSRGGLRLTTETQPREAWLAREDNRREWERLREALALADGFVFLIAQCGDRTAEALLGSLLEEWASERGMQLAGRGLSATTRVSEILDDLRDAARPCVFWFPDGAGRGEQLDELFGLLNQKREVVAQLADAPLVMAMHQLDWARFRRRAPDFWSIHQAVFRFSPGVVPTRSAMRGMLELTERGGARRTRSGRQRSGWRLDARVLALDREARFVGRRTELDALTAMLGTPGAKVHVHGPRGAGKTTLLRQACAGVIDSYPDGIWWIPFAEIRGEGLARIRLVLSRLLGELETAPRLDGPLAALRDRVAFATRSLRALFVIDDLDDAALVEHLEVGPWSSVLVSSSAALPGIAFTGSLVLEAESRPSAASLAEPLRSGWIALGLFEGEFDEADATALHVDRATLDALVQERVVEADSATRWRIPAKLREDARRGLDACSDAFELRLAHARRVLVEREPVVETSDVQAAVDWIGSQQGPDKNVSDAVWAVLEDVILDHPQFVLDLGEEVARARGSFEHRASILLCRADRAIDSGDLKSIEAYEQEIRDLTQEIEDRSWLATLALALGGIEFVRGKFEEAEHWILESLVHLDAMDDQRLADSKRIDLYASLARVAHERGDLKAELDRLSKGLGIARKLNSEASIAEFSHELGALAESAGDFDSAERWYRESLSSYEQLGDRTNITRGVALLSALAWQRGDIEQASQYALRGLALAEPGRDDELIAILEAIANPPTTD